MKLGSAEIDGLKSASEEIRSLLESADVACAERERAVDALRRLTSALEELTNRVNGLQQEIDRRRLLQRKHLEENVRLQQFIGEQFQNSLAQHLVATRMSIWGLFRKVKKGASVTARDLEQLSDYLKVAEREAKSLVQGIIPLESGGIHGLIAALEQLVSRVCELWENITCRLEADELAKVKDDFVALKLYYIAREAVNNALRHAQASKIIIRLIAGKAGETILEIEDDGIGIDEKRLEQDHGLGLEIMQLRAELIKGQFEIANGSEGGTLIRCTL